MEECGICFKDIENNLIISDSDTNSDSDSDSDSDSNNDIIKKTIIKKNLCGSVYNPISIELLNCKTDKCTYKLCDECKELYYFKYKNTTCPNCREKIENIDELIENAEQQNQNTNENLSEDFDYYYFPTHGLCRMTFFYCKNCIICIGTTIVIGAGSMFLGSLIIDPKMVGDDFIDDRYNDNDNNDIDDYVSISSIYVLQFIFGFFLLILITNILRTCFKKCFQE